MNDEPARNQRPATAQTVYTGRATNPPLLAATLGIAIVLLVAFAVAAAHPVGLLVGGIVIAVCAQAFTSVSVAAGPRGVTVRYGFLGLPRRTYPAASIAAAEATDLSRLQMGGWGWHWSPWRGSRMTVRSGPTLRLQLSDGGRVAISAPDPDSAARVVNAAVAAR